TLTTMCKMLNVAVQTIKGITRAPWQDGQTRTTTTWYAPLTDQPAIDRAVWWVLGNPSVFLNTASDIHMLPKILDAARRFEQRPSDAEMQADVTTYQMAPLFT
ncbi:MAG: aldo/keto reductase, partial [Anaerolineae bacterium]|nr:aldo/keto reductase [Anaerolineae bacterium]